MHSEKEQVSILNKTFSDIWQNTSDLICDIAITRKVRLMGGAALVLAIGTLVYLIDRQGQADFLPSTLSYPKSLSVFGVFGGFLPSFAHTFSFIIISSLILLLTERNVFRLCLFWGLLEAACELMQLPAVSLWLRTVVSASDGIGWFLVQLSVGKFDSWDVLAIMLGAWCAYCLLLKHIRARESL